MIILITINYINIKRIINLITIIIKITIDNNNSKDKF